MQLSLVIPLLNECESLTELYRWTKKVLDRQGYTYEILFIDDGSSDASWDVIAALAQRDPAVKGIRFERNYGKSQALQVAFAEVRGEVVITLDADLQDSPEEIPELHTLIHRADYDMVSGWKKVRKDSLLRKNLPSKLFNWAARKNSGLSLHDFNCGLKAYKNKVVKSIHLHSGMHRYIPILVKEAGFKKIGEKVVRHQARKYGKTKFDSSRFINGFLDLLSLTFITRFGKNPMHLFGSFGVLMFALGLLSACSIGAHKIYHLYAGLPAILVTDNPWFYIALTCMIIGTQLFLAGFLAELLALQSRQEKRCKIAERTPENKAQKTN